MGGTVTCAMSHNEQCFAGVHLQVTFSTVFDVELIVQQLSDKFCENCSLCDKSTKFCITKD